MISLSHTADAVLKVDNWKRLMLNSWTSRRGLQVYNNMIHHGNPQFPEVGVWVCVGVCGGVCVCVCVCVCVRVGLHKKQAFQKFFMQLLHHTYTILVCRLNTALCLYSASCRFHLWVLLISVFIAV